MDVKWTTENPTEPGWYFAYGTRWKFDFQTISQKDESVSLVLLTKADYKEQAGYPKEELYMDEGTNWEQTLSNCGYTHWFKVEMPSAP